ncbi:MAG: hypothetical protein ACI9GZ_001187 [Bacteroidia bacterium]|jgi:hypothetical protein
MGENSSFSSFLEVMPFNPHYSSGQEVVSKT